MFVPALKPRLIYPLLLIVGVALLAMGLVQSSQQRARPHFRWEYQIVEYGPSTCANEELQKRLNKAGDEGWEMTSFTPPTEDESQIVLQTASRGYGKEVVHNLVHSRQGAVSPTSEPGCRVVFRRPSY